MAQRAEGHVAAGGGGLLLSGLVQAFFR
jgi:hypothetical protein